MRANTVWIVLVCALLWGLPARAQEEEKAGASRDAASEWVGPSEVVPVPGWTIKDELRKVEAHMGQFGRLVKTLTAANQDLAGDFQRYLKDPKNKLLASSVERKMALYAKRVIGEFDQVLAQQDVSSSNFRNLQRKIGGFSQRLGSQAETFKERLTGFQKNERGIEKDLIALSVKLREDPPRDPKELQKLKREFAKKYRRLRLQKRYLRGYKTRYQNYGQLKKNLDALANLFVALHERHQDLMENLETERQYMRDTVELQLDTLRIRRLMQENVLGGESALKGATEKLKKLYDAVEAFTQVNARINSNLSEFVNGEGQMVDLIEKIDRLGLEGGPIGNLNKDIESAIDHFYSKKDLPDLDGESGEEEGEAPAAATPAPAAEGGSHE